MKHTYNNFRNIHYKHCDVYNEQKNRIEKIKQVTFSELGFKECAHL